MTGNVTRRGKHSWRIKVDLGRDHLTGKRQTHYKTVRGTKKQAEVEAAKVIASLSNGTYVEGSKETIAQFAERWLQDWAIINTSNRTFDGYAQILRQHVAARIGSLPIQKLTAATLQTLYADLMRAGLQARTVLHVHRATHRMLRHAAQWGVVHSNVASLVDAPSVADAEIHILSPAEVRAVLTKLKDLPIYVVASVALGTGMRRGELLGLRWQDIDLDAGVLRVERSLEQTRRSGMVFKAPKTRHGRRTITLPSSTIAELKAHRRAQQEQRLALGQGKLPDDALVFANEDGTPRSPNALTKAWTAAMRDAGLTATLHSLRHTHASTLIASGLDVLTISRRLGHGSPAITLAVYGHLFKTDDRAAAIMEQSLAIGTE
jgi:integrase